MNMMTGCRLLVSLVLLLIAAAAAFGIPRMPPAFGVRRGAPWDYCFRFNDVAAPFYLGTAAAIHLGNTNSCIAGYDLDPGNTYYQFCIPSWVSATGNGTALAGEAAMNHAAASPGAAIPGFTRLLDRRLQDIPESQRETEHYKLIERRGRVAIQVGTEELSPETLASTLISELKRRAEAHLGREVMHAVIAAPRYLNYVARKALVTAGRFDLGFLGVKVIDHQIAAAAAHHLHAERGDGRAVLVFHLGGRTADATLFKFDNGTAQFIAARSDLFLGGDDFTGRIVDYMVGLVRQRHQRDIGQDRKALQRLRVACEHAKKALSEQEEALVQVDSLVDGVSSFSAPLTRAKLEELNGDLFDRAMGLVDEVVVGSGGSPREEGRRDMVDEIVLVGGSARIPKVRQLVRNYFHGREPNSLTRGGRRSGHCDSFPSRSGSIHRGML